MFYSDLHLDPAHLLVRFPRVTVANVLATIRFGRLLVSLLGAVRTADITINKQRNIRTYIQKNFEY